MERNISTSTRDYLEGGLNKYPKPGDIYDVILRDIKINVDDRGILAEIVRVDWPEVEKMLTRYTPVIQGPESGERDIIKQVYKYF